MEEFPNENNNKNEQERSVSKRGQSILITNAVADKEKEILDLKKRIKELEKESGSGQIHMKIKEKEWEIKLLKKKIQENLEEYADNIEAKNKEIQELYAKIRELELLLISRSPLKKKDEVIVGKLDLEQFKIKNKEKNAEIAKKLISPNKNTENNEKENKEKENNEDPKLTTNIIESKVLETNTENIEILPEKDLENNLKKLETINLEINNNNTININANNNEENLNKEIQKLNSCLEERDKEIKKYIDEITQLKSEKSTQSGYNLNHYRKSISVKLKDRIEVFEKNMHDYAKNEKSKANAEEYEKVLIENLLLKEELDALKKKSKLFVFGKLTEGIIKSENEKEEKSSKIDWLGLVKNVEKEEKEEKQNRESLKNVEDVENVENVENVKNAENVKNVENVENVENIENVENVEFIKNAENVEIFENIEKPKREEKEKSSKNKNSFNKNNTIEEDLKEDETPLLDSEDRTIEVKNPGIKIEESKEIVSKIDENKMLIAKLEDLNQNFKEIATIEDELKQKEAFERFKDNYQLISNSLLKTIDENSLNFFKLFR